MKKLLIFAITVILILSCLVGCGNRQLFDTKYTFNYAYVQWPDGSSEKLAIKSWRDFEDGDQVQITLENGNTYIFHSENCVLSTH